MNTVQFCWADENRFAESDKAWYKLGMSPVKRTSQLEKLIKRFGVHIRHEAIKQEEDLVKVVGGLCLLRGEYVLIISSKATTMERINTLAMALKHFDLDQIYLRPVLRELLDRIPEQRPFDLIDKEKLKEFS